MNLQPQSLITPVRAVVPHSNTLGVGRKCCAALNTTELCCNELPINGLHPISHINADLGISSFQCVQFLCCRFHFLSTLRSSLISRYRECTACHIPSTSLSFLTIALSVFNQVHQLPYKTLGIFQSFQSTTL